MRVSVTLLAVSLALASAGVNGVVAQRPQSGPRPAAAQDGQPTMASLVARLKVLEDKQEIHAVMMEYGRTLDNRDFAGFAALFSRDSEYGGARGPLQKGPAAIRAFLEMQLARNAAPQPGRDYHFFYNETIDVTGDSATALSKGAFYTMSETRKLETSAAVNYHDEFIREDGKWRFKRRILGERPAAPEPAAGPSR